MIVHHKKLCSYFDVLEKIYFVKKTDDKKLNEADFCQFPPIFRFTVNFAEIFLPEDPKVTMDG